MPTGYTHDIKDGISFQQFAMNCARAFGACITMRDDPAGAQIPERFEPSDYHDKALQSAREKLTVLQKMTPAECDLAADEDHQADQASRVEAKAKMVELRTKYEAMLACVESWTPPSTDHEHMKEFMRKQITDSIEFDCSYTHYDEPAVRLSGEEWREQKMAQALGNIDYHVKGRSKEIETTNQRNEWVRLLRESLEPIV